MQRGRTVSRHRGWFARLTVLALVAMIGATLTPLATTAGRQNHGYRWKADDIPFELDFGDNVGRGYSSALNKAAQQWRKSDYIKPRIEGGHTNPNRCRATKKRVEVCSGEYGDTRWLGLTGIWARHGEVKQAVILINDSYLGSGELHRAVVRDHVLCHEMGHALGLGQEKGHKSCMSDSPRHIFDHSWAKPSKQNYNQLKQLYQRYDNNSAAATGDSADFTEAESDLPLPNGSDRSKGSVIIENLGDGGERVTYIFWADELNV